MVNVSSTKKFKTSESLRQGDSLSPFQFLLVMKILSKLVDDAVMNKKINGFQVVEDGIMISHLQFADEIFLFVDAREKEINLEKSTMISVGKDEVVDTLAMKLGCKVEELPF
ncbi:uncharacterized protein LOC113294797 [Papaver somniferum]|uniref:uncharacterized protein LOC113294797 n=1 Tax=Papaver somniferum TaxID=3469 RepID=UPI000E6F629E|nr:uncharacterized protein LOC113294797 [Papaver somniferum]